MSAQHPRTYWTADRSALVEEGDVRAAFLAYPSTDPIPPEHLAMLDTPSVTVRPLGPVNPESVPAALAAYHAGDVPAPAKPAAKPTRKPARRR